MVSDTIQAYMVNSYAKYVLNIIQAGKIPNFNISLTFSQKFSNNLYIKYSYQIKKGDNIYVK